MRESKKPPSSSPSSSPFASLERLRSSLPEGPQARDASVAPEPVAKGPARAVVRLERKGRGGKEVTVVEQLGLPSKELAAWLQALKGSLGCGGALEGESLVLQGDQRDRTRVLLEKRGVRKVIAG